MLAILRLIVACLAVTLTVLASFAPIVAFFAASTTSYHFMVLLNVALCSDPNSIMRVRLRKDGGSLTGQAASPAEAAPAPPTEVPPEVSDVTLVPRNTTLNVGQAATFELRLTLGDRTAPRRGARFSIA